MAGTRTYTRTGDGGETGLFGGRRVRKDDARVQAYGTVDELNAALGLARAQGLPAEADALLQTIQGELLQLGADLASPGTGPIGGMPRMAADQVTALEGAIDRYEDRLPPLTRFVLPGGCPGGAALHLGRTVCRRAERATVALAASVPEVNPQAVIYLNRLSDLLFVLARAVNHASGTPEPAWR